MPFGTVCVADQWNDIIKKWKVHQTTIDFQSAYWSCPFECSLLFYSLEYCIWFLSEISVDYLVYKNLIDQGCTLPNGLKVPNGWENLYNNCQEKCVCRRNKFQCSASGCDLNYNECTVNSDGEEFCHGALLVLFSGDSITDNYARLIDLNGKIKSLNLYQHCYRNIQWKPWFSIWQRYKCV